MKEKMGVAIGIAINGVVQLGEGMGNAMLKNLAAKLDVEVAVIPADDFRCRKLCGKIKQSQ